MEQPEAKRIPSRLTQGALAYLGLNVLLATAEAEWHVLSRLTAWDASQLKILVPLVAKLFHH